MYVIIHKLDYYPVTLDVLMVGVVLLGNALQEVHYLVMYVG
jgi:hypothetical protein